MGHPRWFARRSRVLAAVFRFTPGYAGEGFSARLAQWTRGKSHLSAGRNPRSSLSVLKAVISSIGVAHLQPIVSLIAGILILIMPQLLNYIVAIFLIVSGILGLGLIH